MLALVGVKRHNESMNSKNADHRNSGKARGGVARAEALTPNRRKAIAQKAARARWGNEPFKLATHGSTDHPLKIGDIEIPCYVLDDGTRVLSQRGLTSGIGMSTGGSSKAGEQRLAVFFDTLASKGTEIKDLSTRIRSPIGFKPPGGSRAYGFEATILADICDVILSARQSGHLHEQQRHLADRAEILVRGFARVGIIALVDEATGYERDRVAGSLARILEAFIAKELQPWVRTFPASYYEELFRLRGLAYASDSVRRPQYFGVLTNDIVYKRLAPGVLDELKNVAERDVDGRPKHKYFQKLTSNVGYPKLREHLGSVVTLMKLSENYEDFKVKLDRIHPAYGRTLALALEYEEESDNGKGL
jgi:hypothetical protein